jgi:ATP-dependent DNA helicase DinG
MEKMDKIPAFVALDLETTGLDFEKDEIIEAALVRFENGEPKENLDFLVKPSTAELRPFIETLTGISKADIEAAPDFATVAGQICSFIGDLPIVAHNALFDSKFLKQTFSKVGISYDTHVFWDSLTLSRIAFQNVPNHRLDTLVAELGIERSRAHRALPDADACGRLFVKALEKISAMDPWLFEALSKVSEGSSYESLFATKSESLAAPKYALPAAPAVEALPKSRAPRVSEFFKEGGFVSFVVENYKPRHNQQDFASVMERNMYKGGLCVLEAPTGSGKTLSYLITAANKAITGERVLISTATRTLQEQLWTESIPQIAKIYNGELRPAILKGRDNYLCLRKFEELLMHSQKLLSIEERDSFMALIPWVLTTETGDINDCNSFSQGRNRVLWSKLSSSASSCLGEKCPHRDHCPALIAKRKAMNANMVLVNHSLFLADLQLDFALLPSYEHIVFDEAHRLPEISNQTFGRSISFFGFRNIVKTLEPSKAGGDGLIAEIASRLPAERPELHELCDKLSESLAEAEKALHRFFMKIGKKLAKQKNGRNGFTYVNGIQAEYDADPSTFLEQYSSARTIAEKLCADAANVDSIKGVLNDLEGRMSDVARFISDFEFVTKAGRADWVFYMEEPFNPHTIKLHALPLHSGSIWKEKFYPWIKSATFTSATLSVQADLTYYLQKMGMDTLRVKQPFVRIYTEQSDVNERRSVMIAKYLPKPSTPEYGEALNETLLKVLPTIEENTMVLFTSVATMMSAQAALAPAFAERNKLLLCQHVDGSLDGLVAMFRKERGACLLGCQSLWEGVDFPGDALKLLVITKLPFPNPSDPLVAGLSNEMKAANKNFFKDYFIPEAYMELRQGMGRLLRSDSDSGKVLILDNRVILERYGKTFSRIWNFKHRVAGSADDILRFVK